MNEVKMYIDDSGRYGPTTNDHFLYAGFWCDKNAFKYLAGTYVKSLSRYADIHKEVKSSSLSSDKQKKILKMLGKVPADWHPIYVLSSRNAFDHNYEKYKRTLLRMLLIHTIDSIFIEYAEIDHIYIAIDKQIQRRSYQKEQHVLKGQLEKYCRLNKRNVKIKVSFLDSHKYRGIQIADLIANNIYRQRYNNYFVKVSNNKTINDIYVGNL